MKNLTSTSEGVWVEIKPITLTKEQKTLMISSNESDVEARIALIEEMKSKSERKVSPNDLDKTFAISKYNEVKPTLKEDDVYELIAINLVIEDESVFGILNCRVNGEHKQIRF